MSKKPVKIVTIGGGSSYTPELMEGFIKRYDELPIKEIWLVDIEDGKEKLEIVGKMAQRMWDASPYDVKVHLTLDRREALKDADFVTTQFRVGLLNARIKDERIPFSYGMLGQETNGAGGMFKALRTIPVILSIVEDMKELCPDAWLVNFTNPSGMVTEAVMRFGKWDKVIGLCNVPVGAMLDEPKTIGKTLDQLTYKFAGLNHFHWHKVYDENGKAYILPESDLPLVLPELEDYSPSKSGDSPLDKATNWVNTTFDGKNVKRETSTMPGSAGSSWYFLIMTIISHLRTDTRSSSEEPNIP